MSAESYIFDLPPELVAQDPPPERGASRLLVVDRGGRVAGQHAFTDLPTLLEAGDLLVCNDSRVLPARLWTRREDTGGRVELLLLDHEDARARWRALARPARRLREGLLLAVHAPGDAEPAGPRLSIDRIGGEGEIHVREISGHDLLAVAEAHGDIPLPPYIRRDPGAPDAADRRRRDRERYQTVYARNDYAHGLSVAAPTAGLHFDDGVLAGLAARGVGLARVSLHVGPGTFRSPTEQQIADRRLHAECFELPAATTAAVAACRRGGGRVYAVGTTSLRVLETVARLDLPADAAVGDVRSFPHAAGESVPVFGGEAVREPGGWRVAGVTRLFVRPPDAVTCCDGLITNFHLPGSSLLMLVAAFAGEATWRAAYADAVARRLRFFSYGDAMMIRPHAPEETA